MDALALAAEFGFGRGHPVVQHVRASAHGHVVQRLRELGPVATVDLAAGELVERGPGEVTETVAVDLVE